jgi:hypothetical protein
MLKLLLLLVSALALSVSPALSRDSVYSSPAYAKLRLVDPMKDVGWVMLRAEGGFTWLYFTTLIYARCALSEVRYSINSEALDRVFVLPACDQFTPSSFEGTADLNDIGTIAPAVETVSVQAVYTDGSMSDVVTYAPCADAGHKTCARRVPN